MGSDSTTRRFLSSLLFIAFFLIGWAALQFKLDYVVLSPGPALDVGPMISVRGAPDHSGGSLYLTTVYSDMDVHLGELVQAQIGGTGQVLPKKDVLPPTMSAADYSHLVLDMMEESKTVARIVALQKLGYDVKASGEGARVEQLLPGNKAEGVLAQGDVVVGADGQQIQTANDLVNLVRRQKPGDQVALTVRRGTDSFDAVVGTKESDSEPGIAVVGIMIKTYNFGHNLPVQIDIDSENIGGPSAGLMFTLGIMDAMTAGGITGGHKVAGTGTMSLDGSVGPIGGVSQKVVGAEQSGAEYFLAPADNYEAARQSAHRINVVRVGTVDDAIAFLKGLQPAHKASLLSFPQVCQPAA